MPLEIIQGDITKLQVDAIVNPRIRHYLVEEEWTEPSTEQRGPNSLKSAANWAAARLDTPRSPRGTGCPLPM